MDESKCDRPASFSCLLPCLRCHEDAVPLEPRTRIESSFLKLLLFMVSYHSLRKETDMVGFFFTVISDDSGPGRLRDVSIGLLSTAFRNYGCDLETTVPKLEPLWRLLPRCDLGLTSISEEEDDGGTLSLHLKLPGFCMNKLHHSLDPLGEGQSAK